MGSPQSPFSFRPATGGTGQTSRSGAGAAAPPPSLPVVATRPATVKQPSAPHPCLGVPSLGIACARLTGVVGPLSGTQPGPPANNYADVLLVQQLINVVVSCGYVDNSVLGGGNGKLATPLIPNGQWSTALFNAIRQVEVLYFHGRANPHGIGVIDPQADESLFTFLVGLANGSQKAKQQLSVQMKALAAAMVPDGMAKMDAGGKDPDGNVRPPIMTKIDFYLPGLLDALTKIGLNSTDWILLSLACVRTETRTFVPHNEDTVYDLNTSGDFRDLATGNKVWSSNPATVHSGANPGLLRKHYLAAVKTGHVPTEKWSENEQSTPGDIYQTNKGLGNVNPGDGWLYRGRGFIQLTGRGTYKSAGEAAGLGDLFVREPDSVNSEKYAGAAIAGYLKTKHLILEADLKKNDLERLRRHVNGANYGLKDFKEAFAAGRALIAQRIIVEAKVQVQRKRRRTK